MPTHQRPPELGVLRVGHGSGWVLLGQRLGSPRVGLRRLGGEPHQLGLQPPRGDGAAGSGPLRDREPGELDQGLQEAGSDQLAVPSVWERVARGHGAQPTRTVRPARGHASNWVPR